ncbi:MAG TPA: hypothetical protein VH679_15760 [Vicinamibacterales bacterium]
MDLEHQIDRDLHRLRAPRAPETLVPRVMRAVRSSEPASAGAWFTWPLMWQVASLAIMVLALTGAARLWPIAVETLGALASGAVAELTTRLAGTFSRVTEVAGAGAVIWRVVQPVAVAMVVLVTVMCGACAAFGAALRCVVLGGTLR